MRKIPYGLNIFDLSKAADISEGLWESKSPEDAVLAVFEYLLGKSEAWSPRIGDDLLWISEYGWIGGKLVGIYGETYLIRHNDGIAECFKHQIRP